MKIKNKIVYMALSLFWLPAFAQEKTLPADTIQQKDDTIEWGFNIKRNANENTAAISVIGQDDLNSSATNVANALYGKIPGLMVMQGNAEPWDNDPKFYIRGLSTFRDSSPLILVDGFERPLLGMDLSDVESIEVIKDAAALCLYGMRGANGVILVKTKRGKKDDLKVNVSYQFGIKTPFRLPDMANGPAYANAMNEALLSDGLQPAYSEHDLRDFASGANSELLPNVDWLGTAFRNKGYNHQLNASFSGGSDWIRYYSSVNYIGDRGFLRPSNFVNDYEPQLNWDRLSARMNLDIDVSPSTLLKMDIMAQISQAKRYGSEENVYELLYDVPSAAFPVRTSNGHWGGDRIHANPIAEMANTGYTDIKGQALFANLRLEQDLSMFLEGLSADIGLGFDNYSETTTGELQKYAAENIRFTRNDAGQIPEANIIRNVYGVNTDLAYAEGLKQQNLFINFQGKVNYNRTFNRIHSLKAMAGYQMESNEKQGRNTTYRRQNIMASALYGYKDKYYINGALSYAGSSVLSKDAKFAFFPSVSAAWVASSEEFLKNSDVINYLKVRASWGITGSDLFIYDYDKQYYFVGRQYHWGPNNDKQAAIYEGRLANTDLKSETAYKTNIGFDLSMFNSLSLTADVFYEKRNNILLHTANIYSGVIGIETPTLNIGKVKNYGVELGLNWTKKFNDWTVGLGGNFTFARNEIVEMAEGYVPEEYLKSTGRSIGQFFGLQSIGYFKDDADISSSTPQAFAQVKPGDIKYKDMNGDKIINEHDATHQGYSMVVPEIYYGFSFNVGYKSFTLRGDFQGIANYSVAKDMTSVFWPLANNTSVSEHYLENRWTKENPNAKYPRLTTLENQNNFRASSTWLESGAFLKLRNLELSYLLPQKVNKTLFTSNIRVFARGMNLFSIDSIKILDPEQMYAAYPSYRSYHLGFNIEF